MKLIVDPLLDNIKKYDPEMTEAQLRTRRFGLESLVTELSKTLIYLILFSVLGVTLPFLVSFLVYGSIRAFTGGYHSNSYWGCFFVSLAGFMVTIGAGYYSNISNAACLTMLVISLVVNIVFAPVSHPNKPNKDPAKRKRFKIISSIIILVFGSAAFLMPSQYRITVIASISLAALMQLLGLWLNNKTAANNKIGV